MNLRTEKFFTELQKYESEGAESMDWVEWDHYDIDETIVSKFNHDDWTEIKNNFKHKPETIKSLIIGHIHLDEIEHAEVKLDILTEIILTENSALAFDALKVITFGFITSGRSEKDEVLFHKQELKGIFLTKNKNVYIGKYFTNDFLNKVSAIAEDCSAFQKNEILAFTQAVQQ